MTPYPLGRLVNHDPRSLRFPFKAPTVTITSVEHKLNIAPLDQGNLGSCTGNADVHALSAEPFWGALTPEQRATLNESLAAKLYSRATAIDPYPGQYPPTDTGSDGLSVAKVTVDAGYISGYTHAFNFTDALSALTLTTVIVGVNWYQDMFDPTSDGELVPGGGVAGGHEFCLYRIDAEQQRVWMRNSWSAGWGVQGNAWLSYSNLQRLLSEDGDCTIFVPLSAPAPTPTPAPPPVDPDAALWSPATKAWASARHVGANAAAARSVKAWAAAKGI